MLGNKEIMGKNIKIQMELHGVNATDVCSALGFKHNTFSNWINGVSYPRIDKIELLANYFGVSKAALVEEQVLTDYTLGFDENKILLEIQKLDDEQKRHILSRLLLYYAEYLKEGGDL